MERATKVGLGCGGIALGWVLAGFLGCWSMVAGRTSDPAEVRALTEAILPGFQPIESLVPTFASSIERRGGKDEAVIWAVDSRYQNLLLVLRESEMEPDSADHLVELLTEVHWALNGFEALPGSRRAPILVQGVERSAIVQEARTVDESKQVRICLAFPREGRWILLMLQGDPTDVTEDAIRRLLPPA